MMTRNNFANASLNYHLVRLSKLPSFHGSPIDRRPSSDPSGYRLHKMARADDPEDRRRK